LVQVPVDWLTVAVAIFDFTKRSPSSMFITPLDTFVSMKSFFIFFLTGLLLLSPTDLSIGGEGRFLPASGEST
jgi:hypothetical protein